MEQRKVSSADRDAIDISSLTETLRQGLDIRDRKYHLRTYKSVFVGNEAVSFMLASGLVSSLDDALSMGNLLLAEGIIEHVTQDHDFKNEHLFYRFKENEKGIHGEIPLNESSGKAFSWADFLGFSNLLGEEHIALQGSIPEHFDDILTSDARRPAGRKAPPLPPSSDSGEEGQEKEGNSPGEVFGVSPLDAHNVQLLDHVHPAQWVPPLRSGEKYNMVVIGAGAGGLITAAGAAGVGARVALIEENLLGGDCLNVGCVPSKALIAAARAAKTVRNAAKWGVSVTGSVEVDFAKVMEHVRSTRAHISKNDAASRYAEELGVDVYFGRGEFLSKNSVCVGPHTLTFARACIATGGRAHVPPIPGLRDVKFLTNESVFNLTELPKRLGVIGAGPIGLELAQAFACLGSSVTVFARSSSILDKEEAEAVGIVAAELERDGVKVLTNIKYNKISSSDQQGGAITISYSVKGEASTVEVDQLLVAAGRVPNVTNLGLENAAVRYDPRRGVEVDDHLQTTNPNIYAVGDVCTRYKFTHAADAMARLVIRNALFYGRGKFSAILIPWATYTDPEIAHVGLYARDLEARSIQYDTYQKDLEHNDRAITDGHNVGYVRILCRKGTDEILGATVVGPEAGNIISEVSVAMAAKLGLGKLAAVVHPYPTIAESVRACGDLYNRTRLTPTVKTIFRGLLKFQRR